MRKAIQKAKSKSPLYETVIRRMSPKLKARFIRTQKTEKDLERWNQYMSSAERQQEIAEKYQEYAQALEAGESDVLEPVQSTAQLGRALTTAEKEALKRTLDQAEELCRSLKGDSEDRAKLVISGAIQGIRTELMTVDWDSIVKV
jgi:hypothetical protein